MSETSENDGREDVAESDDVEGFCIDANEHGSPREVLSPSGRFKLVLRHYGTKAGCWDYSRGTVWSVDALDGEPVADVKRNYSSFPFAWVEDHPNGHSYLVCGADYQGQTVVELDTRTRLDHLPEDAKDGVGFCWIDYEFHAPTQMLIANGCIWACPYETRFYDFRTPMLGWPEIEADKFIDCDAKQPEIDPDGVTIRCFESTAKDEEDEECKERVVDAISTFRREGDKLVFVEEWVSEAEKKKRADREESNRQYEAWKSQLHGDRPALPQVRRAGRRPRPLARELHGLRRHVRGLGQGIGLQRRRAAVVPHDHQGVEGWLED